MNVYTVECAVVICRKCQQEKPLSGFSTNGAGRYKKRCKACRSLTEVERVRRLPPDQKAARFQYIADWVRRNPEKYRGYAKATRLANPEHYKAKVNLRRLRNRVATPSWANAAAMAEIYKRATQLTKKTGIPHEVDHIVPLLSERVCGLHCEANLRVIPMIENKRKNNKTWPDMP